MVRGCERDEMAPEISGAGLYSIAPHSFITQALVTMAECVNIADRDGAMLVPSKLQGRVPGRTSSTPRDADEAQLTLLLSDSCPLMSQW